MPDGLKRWLTGYTAQGILALAGLVGLSISKEQHDTINAVAGGIVSGVALLIVPALNYYMTQKKKEGAAENAKDLRTQAILGVLTPAIEQLLQQKERQIADPERDNPDPLIKQVGVPPAVVAKTAEKIVKEKRV